MNHYPLVKSTKPKWVRSNDGILLGVCEGLAKAYNFDPNKLRIFLFVCAVFFGTGVFAYIFLGLLLPREDKLENYHEQKILGVCYRLHRKTGIELGVIRTIVLFGTFGSVGVVLLGYLALAFFMPQEQEGTIF